MLRSVPRRRLSHPRSSCPLLSISGLFSGTAGTVSPQAIYSNCTAPLPAARRAGIMANCVSPTVHISQCNGPNAYRVKGFFDATGESSCGKPVYRKRDGDYLLHYSDHTAEWIISGATDFREKTGFCFPCASAQRASNRFAHSGPHVTTTLSQVEAGGSSRILRISMQRFR